LNDPQEHRNPSVRASSRGRGRHASGPASSDTAAGRREILRQRFQQYLHRAGMKSTRQRDLIVDAFVGVEEHVSVEELLVVVRRVDPSIGYATVYRTLKLLVDAGVASLRNFGEGFARYEPSDQQHHEHLICEICGRIEEFHDEFIEARQEVVIRELGYRITHHRHDLFGVCPNCLQERGEEAVRQVSRGPGLTPGTEQLPEAFRRYLSREGLKTTRQRDLITELFAQVDEHVSVEDLLELVKERDAAIGYATVYRTLKLLVESGLAACRNFGDGFTRFEPRSSVHHDHFIDEQSGRVIEFLDDQIERRQEEVAAEYGFRLTRHRHELFGVPLEGGAGS
jgi:Fur family transcriptional regulator, ferric uptake regulator